MRYRNPILPGFYPDPSICRVGSDFFLANSTFAYFPGIPVFHSRDLAHWNQIGNAIDRNGQLNFDNEGISRGLFAPTIRYSGGIFYILCTMVDKGGNFIITAQNPAGPWSDPVWLSAPGIDPSIFFDDDGSAWYIGTRPNPDGEAYPGNWEIWIQEIDLALLNKGKDPLVGESRGIWRGALRDCIWPEGPHIYKINGRYYLIHAEGGTGIDHAVCVVRSESLAGRWQGRPSNPLVTHRHLGKAAAIVNVGHADLFDDPLGNWWITLLASRPFSSDGAGGIAGGPAVPASASNGAKSRVCPLGRETFLAPIRWEDGWPFIATETGLLEWEGPLPDLASEKAVGEMSRGAAGLPADAYPTPDLPEPSCRHFDSPRLPLSWLTLRPPQDVRDAAYSLSERSGRLRLYTRAATLREKKHPAFAGLRLKYKDWQFLACFEFAPKNRGECAGIALLQSEDYQYRIEACLLETVSVRLIRACGKADEVLAVQPFPEYGVSSNASGGENAPSFVLAVLEEGLNLSFFYGKTRDALKRLACNIDGSILSTEYSGGFVGTVAGVFASGNGQDSPNYADVAWAEYCENR